MKTHIVLAFAAAAVAAPLVAQAPNPADVKFMQGMIGHHAQALEMTALLRTRSNRPDMRLLAQRIDVSQTDEIAFMQRWLRQHGAEAPHDDAHPAAAHDMHHEHADSAAHHALMPGMLTEAEMTELAKASGPEFDRLFLTDMIRHHEGALTMVKQLFATQGAGQNSDVFRFASDVEADQRAEIKRMQTLLPREAK